MSVTGTRIIALLVLIVGFAIGYFTYTTTVNPASNYPFKLGLDLAGGTHLVYRADTASLAEGEVDEAMAALRDVIERRVNVFGVTEPIVQVEESSALSGVSEQRLVVELPGVTDVAEAVELIGKTPLLEFKLVQVATTTATSTESVLPEYEYVDTGLTGRFVTKATLQFVGTTQGGPGFANEPVVQLTFNDEGQALFTEITGAHVGEPLAIFLDNELISAPVIQEAITGGTATISGNFGAEEAQALVRNLNIGALPVPIELASTQTVGATLGADVLARSINAALWGFVAIVFFMVAWYRLPGLIASLALVLYIVTMLAIFKIFGVTISAAGLAGFILSIGMAVDANVLIFERMKEELAAGRTSREAAREGFARAWLAIRDGNISSIFSAIVLYYAGTFLTKSFAFAFGIGIVVHMVTAISVTRTFLYSLPEFSRERNRKVMKYLFSTGFSKPS